MQAIRFMVMLGCFVIGPALAQAPMLPPRTDRITERIGAQLGALMIENAGLTQRVSDLQEQINTMQKRIQELEKDKSK